MHKQVVTKFTVHLGHIQYITNSKVLLPEVILQKLSNVLLTAKSTVHISQLVFIKMIMFAYQTLKTMMLQVHLWEKVTQTDLVQ